MDPEKQSDVQAIIHPLSDVRSVHIGSNTTISQFVVILKDAVIGSNCNISSHTYIEDDVVIGNNVTIKAGVYIWNGMRIEDDVFVGPSVVFTNDRRPRSSQHQEQGSVTVKKGARLGASTSILPGITIGEFAVTGMGAVITRDVPAFAMVNGNPAKILGWVDRKGKDLTAIDANTWIDEQGNTYSTATGALILQSK
jgi:UDP-2-acetamido-3-amino-2,3-dideoxy-glucuronate N-acetyltransferase